MSRELIPFSAGDISALARSLREQLSQLDHTPGHVEMLNLLARSVGHRNFQSLRADAAARQRLEQAASTVSAPVDHKRVERALRCFDADRRLTSWPARTNLQELCLWVLWSALAPRTPFTELELNGWLRARHTFADHALLRREMCDRRLVSRTADGREYRRVEQRPPADAAELIHLLSRRAG